MERDYRFERLAPIGKEQDPIILPNDLVYSASEFSSALAVVHHSDRVWFGLKIKRINLICIEG